MFLIERIQYAYMRARELFHTCVFCAGERWREGPTDSVAVLPEGNFKAANAKTERAWVRPTRGLRK